MTVVKMTRIDTEDNYKGAVFYNLVSITSGYSDAYKLPVLPVYAIGMAISGDGFIEVTADSQSMVEADTAEWTAWDGTSALNLAITFFRVDWTSGTVVGKVTVKTTGAHIA